MQSADRIKQIVSTFIDKAPDEITRDTVIDRRAVKGSIMIHRMFAVLGREGITVPRTKAFATFGALLDAVEGEGEEVLNTVENKQIDSTVEKAPTADATVGTFAQAVGIDIESVANMPEVTDYRGENFYRQNFTEREISHCILQKEPLESFAGLFCAKESIVKADNAYAKVPFHKIEILFDGEGRPYSSGFMISISHTTEYAVAIALKAGK